MSHDRPEQALVALAAEDPRVLDEVHIRAEQFGDFRCRAAWERMAELHAAGKPFDTVVLFDELAGHPAQSVIVDSLKVSALRSMAGAYAAAVRSNAVRRAAVEAVGELFRLSGDEGTPGEELVSEALRRFSAIDTSDEARGQYAKDIAGARYREYYDLIREREEGRTVHVGVPTGIDALDQVLGGGLGVGIATVGAGRPGMGKSSLGMQATRHAAIELGIGAHVFSLEETRERYADRMFSGLAQVSSQGLRNVSLTREEFSRVRYAAERLKGNRHWYVDDGAALPAAELIRQVRRMRRELDTHVVVVDYLQLLAWPRKAKSEYDAVSWNMDALANAAKQDRIAYLVLSQLSRKLEERSNKRPLLSDLRQSGKIEERAKAVVFVYRDAVYNDQASPRDIDLIVAKNNDGETGVVRATWNGPTTTISN